MELDQDVFVEVLTVVEGPRTLRCSQGKFMTSRLGKSWELRPIARYLPPSSDVRSTE